MDPKDKLIVALDVDTFDEARILVEKLQNDVNIFKVGSQLFTACGPVIVRHLTAAGKKVFLDLKYHDIPNTVANAVRSAVRLNVPVSDSVTEIFGGTGEIFLCTLHTLGGQEMLEAAVKAARDEAAVKGVNRPLLLGITVLTSDAARDNIHTIVTERARLAKMSGLDGVVASSQEAEILKSQFGRDLVIVTPGIRPKGTDAGDQKRVTTPYDAIKSGSDYLVVGRPIVKADDPAVAARQVLDEIIKAY
jgi:orotidine-5'-phosphate decarboxylase